MIVSCPSCGARYRVDATPDGEHGRCSGCGSDVPIVSAPRPYVLLPATAGGAPWQADRPGRRGAAAPGSRPGRASDVAPAASSRRPSGAAPYDPWVERPASPVAQDIVPSQQEAVTGRAGSPLLPALLAVVGALLGYWAGSKGLFSGIPVVSLAGSAGLAVFGASVGLLAGWAADRWTTGN